MARLQGAAAWRRRSLRRAELPLVCSGEEGGVEGAAGAAALAAAAAALAAAALAAAALAAAVLAAAWEGEVQEMSNLQESTARIPDVRSSILTLIELRG